MTRPPAPINLPEGSGISGGSHRRGVLERMDLRAKRGRGGKKGNRATRPAARRHRAFGPASRPGAMTLDGVALFTMTTRSIWRNRPLSPWNSVPLLRGGVRSVIGDRLIVDSDALSAEVRRPLGLGPYSRLEAGELPAVVVGPGARNLRLSFATFLPNHGTFSAAAPQPTPISPGPVRDRPASGRLERSSIPHVATIPKLKLENHTNHTASTEFS
jgi:hypothetical protein